MGVPPVHFGVSPKEGFGWRGVEMDEAGETPEATAETAMLRGTLAAALTCL